MKIFCESIEKGTAKTGNEFLKVKCQCIDGNNRVFYLWDGVENFETSFNNGQKIYDCMFGGDANFPKITEYVGCEGDPSEFYQFIYPNDEYSLKLEKSLINTINNQFYKDLILTILGMAGPKNKNIEEHFITIPAAKAYHHNYKYGLIQHTYEVMSFVSRVCDSDLFKETLDKDIALCGAFLHDIGKVYEYDFDGVNSCEYGTSLEINQIYAGSHLYKGAELVAIAYEILKKEKQEYNTDLYKARVEHIKHIIMAHHLQRDWGAIPKTPQTLESLLVFLGDYFSAAYGKFKVIDWENKDINNLLGETSKYDTFIGFTPLINILSAGIDNQS